MENFILAGSEILEYLVNYDGRIDRIISGNSVAQTQYYSLFKKFCAYGELANYPKNLIEVPSLPFTIIDPRPKAVGKIQIESFRKYFEIMLSSTDYAIEAFKYFIKIYQQKGEI